MQHPKNKNNIYTVNNQFNVWRIWQLIFKRPISSFQGRLSFLGHVAPDGRQEWIHNEQRLSWAYEVGILKPTSLSSQPIRDSSNCFTLLFNRVIFLILI